jgi:hypothetical protein
MGGEKPQNQIQDLYQCSDFGAVERFFLTAKNAKEYAKFLKANH